MQPLYEYVCHLKGHRNSKGELAEWVIKSHETGEILSSHKSEKKAKEHLQQMHIFNEAAEGEEYCSHCGANADGIETYKGRKLCPSCLTQFKWLDEHRDPENGMYEKYDLVPRESENDDTDGSEKEEFRSLLYSMANGYVNDINKFLRKYDISIELIDRETVESEELFDEDSQDLAMAFASLRDDPKVTPIGLNEDLIYYYYVEQFNESYTLFDEFMSDTLWHEAGHAICRWVEDMLDLLDAQYINDEEALVENFGFYMTSKTMHIDKDVSRKLLSKFNGAFAVMDAYNKGCYDDAALRKMLKLFSPNLDSEKLADILETHDIHKKQSASSIQDKKSDKLIGESTYGNDMDKRIKIFMEGVNQLGLSKNQVDAIGKITNVCMEGMEDGDFGAADFGPEGDFGAAPPFHGPSPDRDAMEEYQLDQVYNELWKLGVPTDTINARGRAKDFSFNTMYQLLKEVCNWKGVPVPEIMGVEDYKTSVSDLGGDGVEEEPAEF